MIFFLNIYFDYRYLTHTLDECCVWRGKYEQCNITELDNYNLKYEQIIGFPHPANTCFTGDNLAAWAPSNPGARLQRSVIRSGLQSTALQWAVSTRIARRAGYGVEVRDSSHILWGESFFSLSLLIDLVISTMKSRSICAYWQCCMWNTFLKHNFTENIRLVRPLTHTDHIHQIVKYLDSFFL